MSYDILQSSTQSALLFFMTDSTDHITGKTGLSPTVTITKNGAAFGSPSGSVSEISSGWYKVAGNATDTGTLGPVGLHATATGADACDMIVANIVSYNPQNAANLGLSALPTANPGAANGVLIAGTNAATTITSAGGDALTLSSTGSNGKGLAVSGNGSGAGAIITGGATGIGLSVIGGGTSGDGIKVTTTSGHGVNLAPVGTSMHGILTTGGNGGTSDGFKAVAGTGGVDIRGNITGNLVGTVSTLTTYTGNTPQTGDAYTRLGAPAGASVSVDVAAVKTDTAAVKVQTDKLVFTVANKLDVNVYTWNGTAVSAPATAGIPEVNVKNINNVSASAVTTVKAVQGLTTADVVASVTGAVGSVTAAVSITSNLKKNQALAAYEFLMTDSTNHIPATGKTVTVTRSINGAAFVAGTLSAVTELAAGMYGVDFGAGDLNGNVIVFRATAVGCDDTLVTFITQP